MRAAAIKKGQSREKAVGFREMGTLRCVWRGVMLDKARTIVAIPYVAETITVVAHLLATEKGLPAQDVREALHYFKAAAGPADSVNVEAELM